MTDQQSLRSNVCVRFVYSSICMDKQANDHRKAYRNTSGWNVVPTRITKCYIMTLRWFAN